MKPAPEVKKENDLDDDMTDLYGFEEAPMNKRAAKKVARKTEPHQTSSRQYNAKFSNYNKIMIEIISGNLQTCKS